VPLVDKSTGYLILALSRAENVSIIPKMAYQIFNLDYLFLVHSYGKTDFIIEFLTLKTIRKVGLP